MHAVAGLVPRVPREQVYVEAGSGERARLLMEDARVERTVDGGEDGNADAWRAQMRNLGR